MGGVAKKQHAALLSFLHLFILCKISGLSYGIGNVVPGIQWQLDGKLEFVHGRKHWVQLPPCLRPECDMDYASRHWIGNLYPSFGGLEGDYWMEIERHVEYLRGLNEGKHDTNYYFERR